jgi:thiamine phosphate synthase YjbQ (UPF0047 family)
MTTKVDITTILYNTVFTVGATATGIWYIFKHGVQNVIKDMDKDSKEDIKTIKHEVLPNSGGSLNDAINKRVIPMIETLVEKQQNIAVDLGTLNGKFEQHIREHND